MRETNLRSLPANDQLEFLDWEARRVSTARQVTIVLARCTGVSEPDAASLTVGEREALLLEIRRLMFGDRMSCVLRCPSESCREKMDLDLNVGDLLLPSSFGLPSIHEIVLDGCLVRFRLPDGADQEAVAPLAVADESAAVEALLERCVLSVEQDGEPVTRVSPLLAERISEEMSLRDPQAEIVLEPNCPSCGQSFRTVLDAASFFFTELAARARTLLEEIHLLASHYHWSEAQILSLPERRRKLYLGLVQAGRSLA